MEFPGQVKVAGNLCTKEREVRKLHIKSREIMHHSHTGQATGACGNNQTSAVS